MAMDKRVVAGHGKLVLPATVLVAALALMVGCRSKKQVAEKAPAPVSEPAPDWVRERPVSDAYYIGIGLCPKSREDYRSTAKQNALNDLASEISVTVQGNSLLYTLDRTGAFNEEFINTVRTSTTERIEGFELVGSYDGSENYYTYYRLDKAKYAALKAVMARGAIMQAVDLHARAKASLALGDLPTAFDQELRALVGMKDRWGENDTARIDGRTVPLTNALFSGLQAMTGSVWLDAAPNPIKLELANDFKQDVKIGASYTEVGSGLAQLPLAISIPGSTGVLYQHKTTDAHGYLHATVQGANLRASAPEVSVKLDVAAMVNNELDPEFTKPLISGLTVPELRVPITTVLPKVFITSFERNMAKPLTDGPCSLALKEELANLGFRTTQQKGEADIVLDLKANGAPAGESNGFHTATADVALTATDRKSGEVLYQGGRQGLKGIQLTDEKAGMDAFKKAALAVRTDLFPAFLGAVIQQ